MGCTERVKAELTKDEIQTFERLRKIEDKLFGNDKETRQYAKLLRKVLFMPDGGDPVHAFNDWFHTVTGVDLAAGQKPRKGDITRLGAMIEEKISVIKKAPEMAEKGHFRHPAIEFLAPVLPESEYRTLIVGGERLFRNTAMAEARRDAMQHSSMRDSNEVSEKIAKMTGEDMYATEKEININVDQLDRAETMLAHLDAVRKQGELTSDQRIELQHWAQVKADSKAALNAIRGRDGKSKGARLMKVIIKGISDGTLKSDNTTRNAFAARVVEEIGLNTRKSEVLELAGMVQKFFAQQESYAKEAMDLARDNLIRVLERTGLNDNDIQDKISELPEFEARDNYFPMRTVLMVWDMNRAATDIENGKHTIEQKSKILRGVIDGALRTRQSEGDGLTDRYDQNIPRVMHNYANEIGELLMVNRMHKEMNHALDLVKELPMGQESRDRYQQMLVKKLEELHDKVIPPSQPARHGLMMSLIGWVAANKLTAPGSMMNNLAEGQTILHAANGVHMMNKVRKIMTGPQGELIREVMASERPEIVAGQEWGDHGMRESRDERIRRLFDRETRDRYNLIDKETSRLSQMAEGAAKKLNKGSTVMTKVYRWAENTNRRTAFEAGAATEFELISNNYRHKFENGEVAARTIREHGLNEAAIREGGEAMEGEWRKFARDRLARAGWDMVYSSQWLYNTMSRHAIEGISWGGVPVGKVLSTFQHYPLSWKNRAMLMYWSAKHMTRANDGSLSWIFDATTNEVKSGRARPGEWLGKQVSRTGVLVGSETVQGAGDAMRALTINPQAQFAMAMGIALLGSRMLFNFLGVKASNFLSGPEEEIAKGIATKLAGGDDYDVMYGKGVANQLTGPMFNSMIEAAGLLPLGQEAWNEDFKEALRLTTGYTSDQRLLSKNGTRSFDDFFDVFNWSVGHESNSALRKSRRVVRAWNSSTDPRVQWGSVIHELSPTYPDWDAAKQRAQEKKEKRMRRISKREYFGY